MDVGAVQNWLSPHWLQCFGDLAPPLTSGSTEENRQESGPCASTRQYSGAGLGGRGMGEPALGMVGADPTTHLPWGGTAHTLPLATSTELALQLAWESK